MSTVSVQDPESNMDMSQFSETNSLNVSINSIINSENYRNVIKNENDLVQSPVDLGALNNRMEAPLAGINCGNNEAMAYMNKFHGHQLNKVDEQLTSQILSSIRNKLAGNLGRSQLDGMSDFSEQSYTERVIVKQEIPDSFVDSNNPSQELYSFPQTSHPVYHNSYSRSSVKTCSTSSFDSQNASPDSSVFPTYPSASHPTSSLNFDEHSQFINNNWNTASSPTEFGQSSVLTRSDQSISLCDSSQAACADSKLVAKQTNLLPPCRVCGEKASGFHYGANTCEACKGFFRRSLKKDKLDFRCNGDNTCKIQKGRRNNCALCRYNRCISAGMSKNAIKTGRYTHEKRTQDIVEVKALNGELGPDESGAYTGKLDQSCKPLPLKKSLSEENRMLLDHIYAAHKAIFPFWHMVLDSGSNKVVCKNYAEKFELERKQQEMSVLSLTVPKEVDALSQMKTEDSNGQRDTMEELTQHIELAIIAFVRFAKSVPGFIELSLNDQASLVKLSRFEIWMIGAHKFMDLNLKVVSGPRGRAYHIEELNEILDNGFVLELFNFSQAMQEIQLTNEETALLKCVALMFSDRCDLQDPDKVERIQQRLTECLEELLGNGQRFAKVMNALVRLRNLTEWSKRISENMIVEWPNIKKHPLLLEIMSM